MFYLSRSHLFDVEHGARWGVRGGGGTALVYVAVLPV